MTTPVFSLGIGIDGTKVPLALVEGSTEKTTTVSDLLVGLRERGLDPSTPILVGIDSAKPLAAAVKRCSTIRVNGHPQLATLRPGRARVRSLELADEG